jgi:endonuclease G, mitochondrial
MTDQVQGVSELLAPEKANRLSPTWFAENVMNPAINAGPLSVYNTAADLVNLPTVHLKTGEAKAYSPEWFAQGLSSGVGATVPYVIMTAATGSLMGAVDRKLTGTALGAALNPYLTSSKIAGIAGSSIYAALQRPDADHTRLGNAIGTAAGIGVFTLGNGLVKDMPMMQKALAYPVIGFIGGGVMTEASQLASNLKLASNEQALQGAVSGMTMNTVMGLGSDYLTRRLQQDNQVVARKVAEAQQEYTREMLERRFNSKAAAFDPLKSDDLFDADPNSKENQLTTKSMGRFRDDRGRGDRFDSGKSSTLPDLEVVPGDKRVGGQRGDSGNPNLAMGNPSGATTDVANQENYLVVKDQYVMSYNNKHKTPNWVSWQLDKDWMGKTGRSGEFAPDGQLPDSYDKVTASDYNGSGYTRGHNCPSGDRTRTPQDNRAVFLMSNMTPQTADNNAGPWEKLETHCRELAGQGKELYIIAGNEGSKGTIANGINVPKDWFKVVVVLPEKGMGLADVNANTEVIAVEMPNKTGIKTDGWRQYLTTVSAIERHTGYDFLSSVPKDIQTALENKVFGK